MRISDWSSDVCSSDLSKKKTDIMQAVAEFNSGDCDALIINVAAATGLSMHASPRFKNTQQRELLEFQIPENPTVRVQLYGRVNRFAQVIPPQIGSAACMENVCQSV